MMLTLDSSITEIPHTGKTLHTALRQVNISTVKDLLFYFPRKYLDFSKFKTIGSVKPGETVTIHARVMTIQSRFSFKSRLTLCEAVVSDGTGSLKVVWFNQGYIAKILKPGAEIFLAGKIEFYRGLQLSNPIYEPISDNATHTGKIVPVYPLTDKLYNKTLQTLIKQVLHLSSSIPDEIPGFLRSSYSLLELKDAVRILHFPDSEQLLEQAKFRIAFDEVFIQQLAVISHKRMLQAAPAPVIKPNIELVKAFLATLPFALTDGQKKALWQILQDMETKHPMNRLLEGDVGSGKTLVAFIAALVAISRKYQVALLAPTEILAKQHHDAFRNYVEKFDLKINSALLTHHHHLINTAKVSIDEITTQLKKGLTSLVIGTHAILQKSIGFKNLGLVIVDEQHRFGVEQRSFLSKHWSGKNSLKPLAQGSSPTSKMKKKAHPSPHLLSMSATPIPRTLALSLYSDLDVTTLTEIPKGRQVIKTEIVQENRRASVYAFIKKELDLGRQAFIVTPRVESDSESPVKAVKAEYKRLAEKIFSGYRLGLLYGGMKGVDKETVMNDFNSGALQILVATSVIEIGIDVPNASVMLIEGAERFGLAQLHQLRGRVGRGAHQSYCFLMTSEGSGDEVQRLQNFTSCNDGFKLAALDLQERGFGSLFGTEQSGFHFKYFQYMSIKTLRMANKAASDLLDSDALLTDYPNLKAMVNPLLLEIHLE